MGITFKRILSNLTFANQLTFLRLILIPFLVISILNNRFGLALSLFIWAAMTDILDGLVARYLKQNTALGTLLDPIADKLLMTISFIILTLPDNPRIFPKFDMVNHVPLWLTILIIWRDIMIVITCFMIYLIYQIKKFPPTFWGKITTFSESITVGLFLLFNCVERESSATIPVAVWVTCGLIVLSGFHYLYRTNRFIKEGFK
ncbi:MAG: CDP-alcohol phosphatidyltransferase family protein [Acidobacteriota bacterium]